MSRLLILAANAVLATVICCLLAVVILHIAMTAIIDPAICAGYAPSECTAAAEIKEEW